MGRALKEELKLAFLLIIFPEMKLNTLKYWKKGFLFPSHVLSIIGKDKCFVETITGIPINYAFITRGSTEIQET